MFSGSASSARQMLEAGIIKKKEVCLAITDKKNSEGIKYFKTKGIPVKVFSLKKRELFKKIFFELKNSMPDYIILSGFMKIIPEWLVKKFEFKILNVHPADLTIKKEGERVLTGLNVIQKAIKLGFKEVRSTIHFVTAKVDAGPILVLSKPLKIPESYKELEKEKLELKAKQLQEKLKQKGDFPAFAKAIQLIKEKKIRIENKTLKIKNGHVFVKGYYKLGKGVVVLK